MIGTPSETDLAFLQDELSVDYVKKFKPRPARNLFNQFPEVDAVGIELLSRMLSFNPHCRPTALECIESSFFDDVRKFLKVRNAKHVVDLDFEHKDEMSADEIQQEFQKLINQFTAIRIAKSSSSCPQGKDQLQSELK